MSSLLFFPAAAPASRPGTPDRSQHHCHRAALQTRGLLYGSELRELGGQAIHQLPPEIGPLPLPSPKADRHFDLVVVVEEIAGLSLRDVEVVLLDANPHPELLDLGPGLLLASFALLDRLLVLVSAVVHETAHRRRCVWRHFD